MSRKISVIFLLIILLFALSACDQVYLKDYNASGVVKNDDGEGVDKVKISFSDESPVYTQSNGSWVKTGLKGDVVITPDKKGYSFEPAKKEIFQVDPDADNSNINFTAKSNSNDNDPEEETYDISGTVTDTSGSVLSNVLIEFKKGNSVVGSTITAADGSWSKTDLTEEVTVQASLAGYTFEPESRSVAAANTNVNFTGTQSEIQTYDISGTVTDTRGSGLSNVLIEFKKGNSVVGSTETAADGSWSKTDLTEEVTVQASLAGYTFEPESRSVAAANTNVNFTAEVETYTASGTVTNESGNPVPGVEMIFDNSFTSVKTNPNGEWEKAGLSGEVVVTPELADWQFTKANATLDPQNRTANFVGRPAINYEYYDIAGIVQNNNGEIIVIEIKRQSDNSLLKTVVTDEDGNWSASNIWGSVEVTPISSGTFSPSSQLTSGADDGLDFKAE